MVCKGDDLATCCGKCNPKVVACIPVFGRLPLLKHTIERLYKKNGVYKVICVGHLPEDRSVCEEAGAEWVQHRNKPLGDKWNKAFEAARKYQPDACLFVGSSDWLSDNWLSVIMPMMNDFDIVGTPGCHFLHLSKENLLCYWPGYKGQREGESIGIGRLISSKLLDKMQWQPFGSLLDRSMDHSMMQKCNKLAGKVQLVHSEKLKSVSISTDLWGNMHQFLDHWNNVLPSEKIAEVDNFLTTNFPEAHAVLHK
jgi:glycosyltransferase involved in cell wall biosynthesis